jgi:hypothetical protein
MDLTRVAFVGHSFDGGATPAMARHGIVEQGWGSRGALVLELAPWYAYQATDAQLAALPASVVQAQEVYEQDDKNDWRLAIDLYEHAHAGDRARMRAHVGSLDAGAQRVAAAEAVRGVRAVRRAGRLLAWGKRGGARFADGDGAREAGRGIRSVAARSPPGAQSQRQIRVSVEQPPESARELSRARMDGAAAAC